MPLAVIRTNLSASQVPKNLMQNFHGHLSSDMGYEAALVMVELQTSVQMMRGGNTDPMITVEFHHNDNVIKEDTKRDKAGNIANFLVQHVNVDINRVLVLFFDTRCTTEQSTEL